MKNSPTQPRLLTHVSNKEREAKQRPLSFAVIRRLLGYTRPYAFRRNVLIALSVIRAIQLPALGWALAAVLNGPVLAKDWQGTLWGALGFFVLALSTAVVFRYRLLLAFQLGEDVIRQLAVAGAATCYAVNAMISKHLAGYPRRGLVAGVMLVSLLWMLPFAFLFEDPFAIIALTA